MTTTFWQKILVLISQHQEDLEGLKKDCNEKERLFLLNYQKKVLKATQKK